MHIEWHPVSVLWGLVALIILTAAVILAHVWEARAGIGSGRAVRIVLRILAVLLIAGYLLRPCLVLRLAGRGSPPLLLIWDRSQSMQATTVVEDSLTRLEAAVGWWSTVRPVLEAERGAPVTHVGFADSVFAVVEPESLLALPAGKTTDIRACLAAVSGFVEPRGRLVLVSDGCHNEGESPLGEARRIGVPVDVVVPWRVGSHADVRIDRVSGRRVISPGDTAVVSALIRWESFVRSESVSVQLARDGGIEDSVVFVADEGWGEREVTLAAPHMAQGLNMLLVSAVGPPEHVTANNTGSLEVEVARRTSRVGVVATAPHPDYGFIRRSVQRDASVSVVGGVVGVGGSLADGTSIEGAMRATDVIVVVAAPRHPLDPRTCERLSQWVRSGAKGLLWLGTSLPAQQSLASVVPGTALDDSGASREIGPGTRATTHPVLGDSPVPWEGLPPLVINAQARAVAGSSVPLTSAETGTPVLALSSAGAGRAAWLNTRTFWRWLLAEGEAAAFAEGLIERLLDWLGQSGGPLRLELTQAGNTLVAEAQLYNPAWHPWPDCLLELTLTDSIGSTSFDAKLGEVPGAVGVYRGRATRLSPGRYRYALTASSESVTVGRKEGAVQVRPSGAELADPVPCTGMLQEIARVSGGRYYGSADLDEWLAGASMREERTGRVCPWRAGWWALAALLLLATEWYLRRRTGLP